MSVVPFNLSPEKLSGLIGLVYDSAMEERQWQSMIDVLVEMYPNTTMGVIGYDGSQTSIPYAQAGKVFADYDFMVAQLQIEHTKMIQENPSVLDIPLGYISNSRESYPEGFKNSDYYKNLVEPLGYDNYYSLKIVGFKDRYVTIAVCLRDDFEEQNSELYELLELLAPHIVRAAQLNRTLQMSRSATEVLSGFLDAIVLPMLVINANGELLFPNAAGRRLLTRGEVFSTNPLGQLLLTSPENTKKLRNQIFEIDRDMCPGGMRITDMDTHISLCMTPFRPSMMDASRMERDMIGNEKLFAIFVGQHQEDSISVGLLQDVFELTPREAEICRDLLAAKSVAEIATASGRSEKTIRNQIQMIYDKVNVSSYAELINAMSVFRVVGSLFDSAEFFRPGKVDRDGFPDVAGLN